MIEPPKLTQEQKINYIFKKKWAEEHPKPSASSNWCLSYIFLRLMILFGGIVVLVYLAEYIKNII